MKYKGVANAKNVFVDAKIVVHKGLIDSMWHVQGTRLLYITILAPTETVLALSFPDI